MKKVLIYIAILTIAGFASCKKEETPSTNNPQLTGNNYVKSIVFNDTLLINTYSYDASWRIISSQGDDNFTVDYSSGTVNYSSSAPTAETGQLNSSGFLISQSDGTNYAYDSNGYLISESNNLNNRQYFWSDEGNLIKIITIIDSSYTDTTTYGYDLTKLNPIRGTENSLKGKQSKNLVTSITYSSSSGSSSTSTFSYIYDSKGRIAIMNQTEGTSQFKFGISYFD